MKSDFFTSAGAMPGKTSFFTRNGESKEIILLKSAGCWTIGTSAGMKARLRNAQGFYKYIEAYDCSGKKDIWSL